MSLITPKDVSSILKIEKFGFLSHFVSWIILKITKLSAISDHYTKHQNKSCTEFVDICLDEYNINFKIPKKDLKNIPKEGAFVSISNHPFGGIEGLILFKIFHEIRPDYKAVANYLLQSFKPLSPNVIPVNPFSEAQSKKSSTSGLKEAILHLKKGMPFGVFPAGEVSNIKNGKFYVDQPWNDGIIRLIQKSKVPVLPLYFHGKNSNLFYKLAKIHPLLQTAKLPSELFSQKNKTIYVRIGKPINVKKQAKYEDLFSYKAFLRNKTYILANTFDKDNLLKKIPKKMKKKVKKKPKKIALAIEPSIIKNEVTQCLSKGLGLFKSNSYEIILAKAEDIPNILNEIGRLREVTYRNVGEGSNKALDLDKYDMYYRHMFLWDHETNQVMGAYRMGLGNEIFEKHGIKGFYSHSLFRFEPELHSMMSQSIEMGRAFVRDEYQKKPFPLFLLWKGIAYCTLKFPTLKYLIGGVTISDQFSDFSMSLMVEFMKSNYYDPFVAQYVRPKKEYKVSLKDHEKGFVFDHSEKSLKQLDDIIADLEPNALRIPVLLKKYIKQNAKVIAFNVDPLFNNAVDGLMYIKIADLPESTIKPLLEEVQKELLFQNKITDN